MTLRTHMHAKPVLMMIALLSIPCGWLARVGEAQSAPILPDNPYGVNVFLNKEVETWKIDKTLQMIARCEHNLDQAGVPMAGDRVQEGLFLRRQMEQILLGQVRSDSRPRPTSTASR